MTALSSPVLKRVVEGQLCAGCGLCAGKSAGAVSMEISAAGFLRPVQTSALSPEIEELIVSTCPGVGLEVDTAGRPDHELWGPHLAVFEGHARDPELRRNGSSGAGLSAMVTHLLETGAVDKVVQIGADPNLPIGNRMALSASAAEVSGCAGSRYAPSAPLAGIEALLVSDQTYAFVGKPCDVAALRALERIDDRVSVRIPYMLSFFCAGVPSLEGGREVVRALGMNEGELTSFRYRGDGWPGFATGVTSDGRVAKMSYADSWGGILSRHVQFRCKVCADGVGSLADIVFADAWETDERGYPVFEERDGVSLVMARTERGREALADASSACVLVLKPYDLDLLEKVQPGQTQKRRFCASRLLALIVSGRPWPRYRGFHLIKGARKAGIKNTLRNFLGTLRRVAFNRRWGQT